MIQILKQQKTGLGLLDRKAIEFIDRHKNEPFFLYYTANLPHGPLIADDLRQKPEGHGFIVERMGGNGTAFRSPLEPD